MCGLPSSAIHGASEASAICQNALHGERDQVFLRGGFVLPSRASSGQSVKRRRAVFETRDDEFAVLLGDEVSGSPGS